MASDDVAYRYDEKKNPDMLWVDGVPRRDLTKGDYEKLPPYLKAAVREQPYYLKVEKAEKATPAKVNKPLPGETFTAEPELLAEFMKKQAKED